MNNEARLNSLWRKATRAKCLDEFLARVYGVLEAFPDSIPELIMLGIEKAFEHSEKRESIKESPDEEICSAQYQQDRFPEKLKEEN